MTLRYRQDGNRLLLSGQLTYFSNKSESVEVDGKIYHRSWMEEVTVNVEKLPQQYNGGVYTDFIHYELKGLYDFHVQVVHGLYELQHGFRTKYSENEYVNILCNALNNYKFTSLPHIYDIRNGKNERYYGRLKELFTKGQIEISFEHYGFNNCVTMWVKDYLFLKLPLESRIALKPNIVDIRDESILLDLYGFDIFGTYTNADIMKLLNKKINNKLIKHSYATS